MAKEQSLIAEETREQKDAKKKDRDSISRKYYTIPEEHIQLIIKRAKAGSPEAREELLKIFDNFLKKYVSLLMYRKCDLRDYDIRKFVSLFARQGYAGAIQRNQINDKVYQEVNEVLRGIHYMVQRYADLEDVEQTVYMTFYWCLERYERRGSIPFSGFLYNYFFYRLKKNVEEFLISQVGRKTFALQSDDPTSSSFGDSEAEMRVINANVQEAITLDETQVYKLGPDKIDQFWVSGESATFPFDKLTINQRQLIKWRFIDGLKAPKIAEKTSEHPNTCRAQLHRVKESLEDILGAQLPDYIDFDLLEIDK
jgi:DNA-directed RNA polymerase specialized sigma24 family protein